MKAPSRSYPVNRQAHKMVSLFHWVWGCTMFRQDISLVSSKCLSSRAAIKVVTQKLITSRFWRWSPLPSQPTPRVLQIRRGLPAHLVKLPQPLHQHQRKLSALTAKRYRSTYRPRSKRGLYVFRFMVQSDGKGSCYNRLEIIRCNP